MIEIVRLQFLLNLNHIHLIKKSQNSNYVHMSKLEPEKRGN